MLRLNERTASALFFIGFGALTFWLASALPMGTAADMGIGYTPRLLAIGCLLVGAMLLAASYVAREAGDAAVTIPVKPLLLVSAMVGGFALLLPLLGLPLTIGAIVLSACVSGEKFSWLGMAAMAVVLATFTTLLFAWALRLQIPILPMWFTV